MQWDNWSYIGAVPHQVTPIPKHDNLCCLPVNSWYFTALLTIHGRNSILQWKSRTAMLHRCKMTQGTCQAGKAAWAVPVCRTAEYGSDSLLWSSHLDPVCPCSGSQSLICRFLLSNTGSKCKAVSSTSVAGSCTYARFTFSTNSQHLLYSVCLQRAWDYVLKCKTNMRPHRGFVKQLSDWETKIYGTMITDISEPNYWQVAKRAPGGERHLPVRTTASAEGYLNTEKRSQCNGKTFLFSSVLFWVKFWHH